MNLDTDVLFTGSMTFDSTGQRALQYTVNNIPEQFYDMRLIEIYFCLNVCLWTFNVIKIIVKSNNSVDSLWTSKNKLFFLL